MSAANAAAIRRRANIQNNTPAVSMPNSQTTNNTNQSNNQKLTLTQFISTLDSRIKTLEENTSNIENNNLDSKIIDEYNTRFEILANEIGELKDVILKLQSFTMEVNKSLYDDRIHIMSDIPAPPSVNNETNNNLINQLNDESEISIEKSDLDTNDNVNTTSVDIKTMVEEEISA